MAITAITSIEEKTGFAAKPVLRGLLHATRPYWRIEIHYNEAGQKKDVDFNLTLFRRPQIETLLSQLKKLRPDLEIPRL